MAKYAEAAPVILAQLEEGATNRQAAQLAGVNEDTFYSWVKEKPEFSEAVQRARKVGEQKAVRKVEDSLLRLATGYEYEDVKSEYGAEFNPATKKLEPVLKKQTRMKRTVPANTEAIKFFLTNKAPDRWKNRQEHDIQNLDILKDLHVERIGGGHSGLISHSEDDVTD